MKTITVMLTPDMGKKLIAKSIASMPDVRDAVKNNTVVIVTGTTNAYVARELLALVGEKFDDPTFYRGITVPKGTKLPPKEKTCDVIIQKGKYLRDMTIFDIADSLTDKDLIFKGANAVNINDSTAAVLVGDNAVGTSLPIIKAVYGRRVKLMIPVGVEKRVELAIDDLASISVDSETEGLRLCPLPGEPVTEIDALYSLFGVYAEICAAGGVMGAEGCVYFSCSGEDDEIDKMKRTLATLSTK